VLAGTAGYGIPKRCLPFLAYTICNGEPNYTGFLQLEQIPFLWNLVLVALYGLQSCWTAAQQVCCELL